MKTKLKSSQKDISFVVMLLLILSIPIIGDCQTADIAKFPQKPITYIHPLPPGSGSDALARMICHGAEKYLGQPIVAVNKPGGSLTVGAAALAVSKPDGYTIGFTSASALLIVPFLEKLPYHPLKDFQQIIQWGVPCFGVTVRADSPFKTFKDLIAYARQNQKKLTYGTSGKVSLFYLIMEQISRKEKVQFTQIPFKGGFEVDTALLGGHIDFGASEFNQSHLATGQTRLLLLFREETSPEFPQAPILKDLGYEDIYAPVFQTIAGPKGIPEQIVKKLEDALTHSMREPEFIKGVRNWGYSIRYRNSKELSDYIAQNYEFFRKLTAELNLSK